MEEGIDIDIGGFRWRSVLLSGVYVFVMYFVERRLTVKSVFQSTFATPAHVRST
jgi:hypothetical protein